MIDLLTIAMTHVLMLIAAWRLMWRDELDKEEQPDKGDANRPWLNGAEAPKEAGASDA